MNNDIWLDVVARGLLWSVDRIQPNGEPMKGYGGTGVKPIVLEEKQVALPVPDPEFAKAVDSARK